MDDVFTETLIIDRSPGFRPKFVHQLPSSGSSGRLQTTCVGGLVVLHGDVSAGVWVPGAPSRSSCPCRSTYRIRRGLLVARGTSGDRSFVFIPHSISQPLPNHHPPIPQMREGGTSRTFLNTGGNRHLNRSSTGNGCSEKVFAGKLCSYFGSVKVQMSYDSVATATVQTRLPRTTPP